MGGSKEARRAALCPPTEAQGREEWAGDRRPRVCRASALLLPGTGVYGGLMPLLSLLSHTYSWVCCPGSGDGDTLAVSLGDKALGSRATRWLPNPSACFPRGLPGLGFSAPCLPHHLDSHPFHRLPVSTISNPQRREGGAGRDMQVTSEECLVALRKTSTTAC